MKRNILLWFGMMAASVSILSAQTENESFSDLLANESQGVEALAMYPRELRVYILKVCARPELVIRGEMLQSKTSEQFRKILETENRTTQEDVFELSRYKGLVMKLGGEKKKTQAEIKDILSGYPEEIHEKALDMGKRKHPLLRKIADLNREAERGIAEIVQPYPEDIQASYRALLDYPEVLGVLAGNSKMMVLAGNIYASNPESIQTKLDSLGLEIAQKNAEELKAYREGLKKDPQALKEMQMASETFARENGYKDEDIRRPRDDGEIQVNMYVGRPYPYWAGYPWWYDHPMWYPRPYWYHWGYYYGPGGSIVVFGMPSWYYCNWYYGHPYHHYHYPYLTNYYIVHAHTHSVRSNTVNPGRRESFSSLRSATNNFETSNRQRVPGNFFESDGNRVARIREFGKFEQDYRTQNTQLGGGISRERFMQQNADRYPSLDNRRTQAATPRNWEPPAQANPRGQNGPAFNSNPAVRSTNPPPARQVDRATTYHQRTWNPATQQQRQMPNARPGVPGQSPVRTAPAPNFRPAMRR